MATIKINVGKKPDTDKKDAVREDFDCDGIFDGKLRDCCPDEETFARIKNRCQETYFGPMAEKQRVSRIFRTAFGK